MTILLLIVLLVLINYIFKQNLYFSALLGTILVALILIIFKGVPLNILVFRENFNFYLNAGSILIFIIGMHYINENIRHTTSKKQLLEIFNKLFIDKNIKILILFLLSLVLAPTPFFNVVVLIFIAEFLNFSSINMIIIPIITTVISDLLYFYYHFFNNSYINNIQSGFIIFTTFYIIMYFLYLLENNKYSSTFLKRNFIDLIFTVLLWIINILFYLIFYNIMDIYMAFITSLFVTILIARFLIEKIKIFANPDQILEGDIKLEKIDKLTEIKVPYFLILCFFCLEVLLYFVVLWNFYLGIVLFAAINVIIVNRIQNKTSKLNGQKLLKFIFTYIAIVICAILIKGDNSNYFADYFSQLVNSKNILISYIMNIQSFSILSTLSVDDLLTFTIQNNNFNFSILIFQLITFIQIAFGIVNYYLIDYIFHIKKTKKTQIMFILLGISSILQLGILLIQGV